MIDEHAYAQENGYRRLGKSQIPVEVPLTEDEQLMKINFFVERKSSYGGPIDYAIPIKIQIIDTRTFSKLAKWKERFPNDFLRPHILAEEKNGKCNMVLNESRVAYYIKDDILDFIRKNGECLVSFENEYGHEDWPTVTIQDD